MGGNEVAQPASDLDPDAVWKRTDWRQVARAVTVNGRSVNFVEMGCGPAVVLIHGQGGCWQWWLRSIPSLAHHARVIAIDLAGYGKSEPVRGSDAIDGQIATVVGVLNHLNISSAVVVGHSMGGVVALAMAHQVPERVRALVVVDSGTTAMGTGHLLLISTAFRVFNSVFTPRTGLPVFVARRPWLRSMLFAVSMEHPAALSTALARQLLPKMAAPGFMTTMKVVTDYLRTAGPPRIECPTLVIWGSNDRILPLSMGRDLAAQISGAELVVFEGVGHSPMLEVPEQFNDAIERFLDELDGGDARRTAE
ncbi:alpha/beta fold hydrolase [Mycolicibacterium sp. CBMA 234]|uniref:alpha/beta fold hydrolase n=1 Tax=Mycolicibacterium sp. CBMA 234 TaxID=1918495 RepID=UPI001391E202|nr:alpha/beta hydrolase [Mycolicibacterium sp. CBMA 234]